MVEVLDKPSAVQSLTHRPGEDLDKGVSEEAAFPEGSRALILFTQACLHFQYTGC